MTLEEAVTQLVNLGEKDPLTIARKVCEQNDTGWLHEQLGLLAEDIVADMARHRLGSERRGAELALRPGDDFDRSAIKLKSFWIPGSGYKRAADLTSDDLRERAKWYEVLTFAARRRAVWCGEVADLIDANHVQTLGELDKLKVSLPPLPDAAELRELVEAV